jgi:hypothetical protein
LGYSAGVEVVGVNAMPLKPIKLIRNLRNIFVSPTVVVVPSLTHFLVYDLKRAGEASRSQCASGGVTYVASGGFDERRTF